MVWRLFLALIAVLVLAACAGGPSATPVPPTLDPASAAGRGQALFRTHCAACHITSGDTVVVGPSLAGIAARAGSRVEGLSAEEYLHDSIVRPNDFTVEGFAEGAMQQNFAMLLTSEEVNDLVAYLMTLE